MLNRQHLLSLLHRSAAIVAASPAPSSSIPSRSLLLFLLQATRLGFSFGKGVSKRLPSAARLSDGLGAAQATCEARHGGICGLYPC